MANSVIRAHVFLELAFIIYFFSFDLFQFIKAMIEKKFIFFRKFAESIYV